MTTQQASNLHTIKDDIDRAVAQQTDYGRPMAPVYGGPQRDAINSVVDGIIGDICAKIGQLRQTLDQIEQQVLQSAARSKHTLNEHVGVCVRINDEIRHMQDVVADLARDVHDA
jgi:hypothetical protein